MKRGADADDGDDVDEARDQDDDDSRDRGGARKRRRPECEARLLIANKAAGGVIGKGGENIKKLRQEFECDVNLPDSNTPERVLKIAGDQSRVLDCIRELLDRIRVGDERSRDYEVRLLINQSQAGAIIGRGGDRIKEIRSETGAGIKIFRELAPRSSDRVIQINGETVHIINACTAIFRICTEVPVKGPDDRYDPFNYDPYRILDYGGYVGDSKFGRGPPPPLPPHQGGFGRPPRGGPRMGGGGDRRRRTPPPRDRGGGGGYFPAPPRNGRGPYDEPPHFRMDHRGDHPPPFIPSAVSEVRGGLPPPLIAPTAASNVAQVTIPDELAGTVIGRRGENINRVRDESGARVKIDAPPAGTKDRIITIEGTPRQIQLAQYLLQQCVRSSPQGRQYIQDQQMR